MRGATAGTLLWADGLQHPALALLQHVFLVMEAGRQLAWIKWRRQWTLLTARVAFGGGVSLQCFTRYKSRKSPGIALGFGNCTHSHHPFFSASNMKRL